MLNTQKTEVATFIERIGKLQHIIVAHPESADMLGRELPQELDDRKTAWRERIGYDPFWNTPSMAFRSFPCSLTVDQAIDYLKISADDVLST